MQMFIDRKKYISNYLVTLFDFQHFLFERTTKISSMQSFSHFELSPLAYNATQIAKTKGFYKYSPTHFIVKIKQLKSIEK